MRYRHPLLASVWLVQLASSLTGCQSTQPEPAAQGRDAQPSIVTLDDARGIRRELERYLKSTERLDVPHDIEADLRQRVIGEPVRLANGLIIPPWRVAEHGSRGVELTWTLDLGHESGTRVWLLAKVDRIDRGWRVRDLRLAHARVARRAN